MSTREPAARMEGVSKRYSTSSTLAVDTVDLEVPRGTWTALVGRSGSGKTTLLQILGGLDRPDSGSLWLFGRDVSAASEAAWTALRRERIGILYQELLFLEHLPVWQNVTCRFVPRGMSARERRERARTALAGLEVEHALERMPSELSGGERQRVALARATIAEPDLILLDEPTSNVDDETGARIFEHLEGLRSGGTTIVVATHDEAMTRPADRTWTMKSGRLASQ